MLFFTALCAISKPIIASLMVNFLNNFSLLCRMQVRVTFGLKACIVAL